MNLPNTIIKVSITTALLTLSQHSWAQARPATQAPENAWSLGAGMVVSTAPYKNMKTKVIVLPAISYVNPWLRFDGLSANVRLPIQSKVSYSLRASYALSDGYKPSDAPILNGMSKRKASLWVGAGARLPTTLVNYSLDVSTDALGYSKGTQAKVQIDRNFKMGQFVVTPRLSATWLDKNYVDYYYGVKDTEVRNNRPKYTGKSTVNTEVGVRTMYNFNPHHSVSLDVSAAVLGSHIKKSPLVDDNIQLSARAWYAYTF